MAIGKPALGKRIPVYRGSRFVEWSDLPGARFVWSFDGCDLARREDATYVWCELQAEYPEYTYTGQLLSATEAVERVRERFNALAPDEVMQDADNESRRVIPDAGATAAPPDLAPADVRRCFELASRIAKSVWELRQVGAYRANAPENVVRDYVAARNEFVVLRGTYERVCRAVPEYSPRLGHIEAENILTVVWRLLEHASTAVNDALTYPQAAPAAQRIANYAARLASLPDYYLADVLHQLDAEKATAVLLVQGVSGPTVPTAENLRRAYLSRFPTADAAGQAAESVPKPVTVDCGVATIGVQADAVTLKRNFEETITPDGEHHGSRMAIRVHDAAENAAVQPATLPALDLATLPWPAIVAVIKQLEAAAERMERLQLFGHTGGRSFHDACVAHSELKSLIAPYVDAPNGYLYSGEADLPEAWIDVCRVAEGVAPSSPVKKPWPANILSTLHFITHTIQAAGVLPATTITMPLPDDAPAPVGEAELGAREIDAVQPTARSADAPEQMVTLQQMASAVNKSKAAVEKIKHKLPAPQIKGGKGKASEWLWADVRPILAEHFNRPGLPEIWPADRFRRR